MKEYDLQIQKDIEHNIERRGLNGTYIYFVAWLAIGIGTDFVSQSPFSFYLVATLLFLLGIFRFSCYWYSSSIKHYSSKVWWYLLKANITLPSIVLSSVFAISMVNEQFSVLFLFLFMTIFALVSSGTVTYSVKRSLVLSYLAANTLIPLTTVLFFEPSAAARLEIVMLFCYSVYMVFQALQLNREYQQKFEQQRALKEMSIRDGLTGIYNRRHFDLCLEQAWNNQLRNQQLLTIVIVDIDYFKKVNDKYGHAAGDKTIEHIAKTLKATFQRTTDITARIGGEEFAVLISNVEREAICELVEQFRESINKKPIFYQYTKFNISVSAGVASMTPRHDKTFSCLMNHADKLLYKAKEQGRNRTVCQNIDLVYSNESTASVTTSATTT